MLELDLLHHHELLDVHEGHGDEREANKVDTHQSFEFCVRNVYRILPIVTLPEKEEPEVMS